ncbi:uncharacterized protein LOC123411163 isoform X2 [Hordeum vulgare subsp. vulgare]|uniref:uncharacterized protein LOC123411163 isoform X2 n=1 Tax=Hordeum vulgare subsp. vulgare TaxID=112509 RepID=UPI001D1A3845|nr:uncharacterized protein LOC123411163 isoform X2 [Hordeum vulgare subsp. vulgare]
MHVQNSILAETQHGVDLVGSVSLESPRPVKKRSTAPPSSKPPTYTTLSIRSTSDGGSVTTVSQTSRATFKVVTNRTLFDKAKEWMVIYLLILQLPWFDSSQERICAKGQLFLLMRITATGCSTTTTSTTALTKLSVADTEEKAHLLQTCMTGGEGAATASFTHQAADTEVQARLLQSLQRSFTFRAWLFAESGGHYFDPLTDSSS